MFVHFKRRPRIEVGDYGQGIQERQELDPTSKPIAFWGRWEPKYCRLLYIGFFFIEPMALLFRFEC